MSKPVSIGRSNETTPATARQRLSGLVRRLAREHGLTVCAMTGAESFPGLEQHLVDHIAAGHLAGMDWFTPDRAAVSSNPRRLMDRAQSLVSVGVAYWSIDPGRPDDEPRGRISRYAWGIDYHTLLKRRMKALHRALEAELGHAVEARQLVDHARIVDRAVAARSGLGWYGKHSCIIVPNHGSWVMLGELLLDLDLEPDPPLARDCGRCQICLTQCPTGAIVAPYTVSAPLCLSFQTIEQRGAIPVAIRPKLGDWVYGCDICQEVCPYTRAARPEPDPEFLPEHVDHAYPSLRWLLSMSDDEFRRRYTGRATLRTKRAGLARNAAVALGNTGTVADVEILAGAARHHDEPLVRGHAAWALGRLVERGVAEQSGRERIADALSSIGRDDPDEAVRAEALAALEGER